MTKRKLSNRRKKQITKDCWKLDRAWLLWLKERLPVYLKDAGAHVSLEYYKFEHEGKTLTQREVIVRMIDLVNWLTNPSVNDWSEEYANNYKELLNLWAKVCRALWW